MGEELCCSREQELDNQNIIRPETNLINKNNTLTRINQPNSKYINYFDDNEYNQGYILKPNYKNYQIQKKQLMYVKPNIKQKYNIGNYNQQKNINNNTRNHINNFSFEIKPTRKRDVKRKRFKNINSNNNINNIQLNNQKKNNENNKLNRYSYYYNENKVEMNNNTNTDIKNQNLKNSPNFRLNIDDNKDNENGNTNLNDNNKNNINNLDQMFESAKSNNNENNNINKNDINNKQEENIENQNDELYSNVNTESNDADKTNNNLPKNDNFVKNGSFLPKNNEIITNNNQNQQINTNINNLEQKNNLYESMKANQNNNNNDIIETKNIENYPSPYNLNNYPSFAPKPIETTNILNNNFKAFQEDANNHQYSHLFHNIDTRLENNPSELNKIFNMIDNAKYYQQDLRDPVLSDEEVDIILKDAEKKPVIKMPTKQKSPQYKTVDYSGYNLNGNINQQIPSNNQRGLYQVKTVGQRNVYKRNGINQNLLLTPERKKVNYYPLTPDYQSQRKKFIINPQKNYQFNNYKPIRRNITPNQIKYQKPKKVIKTNGNNYYLYPPDKLPDKHVVIKSPVKVNPPIVQYSEKVIQAQPITISKIKNYGYNSVPLQPVKKIYSPISAPINTYQKPNMQNNNINNIQTIQNSSKNSILNKSYLNQIQQMNQNNAINAQKNNNLISNINPYNNINNNNNNNLHLSFSSSLSGLSKVPRKCDKFGNPIYISSLHSTPEKIKNYEDYKKNRRMSPGSISSISNDDFSAPPQRRKNKFDDYYSNSPSSYGSPITTPKRNKRINYDMNQFNKKNNINNVSSIKSMNFLEKSGPRVSFFQEENKGINQGIIEATQKPTGLQLDHQVNAIINKYLSTDMENPSTFNQSGYNLFYFSSTEFFRIHRREIAGKKKIIYYINNDPSQQALYEGETNSLNQRHGLGKLQEPNSTKIGLWRNDKFSGWGRIIKKNGQIYEGKFSDDILNGKGVYKYKDVLYIGSFENGVRNGKGVLLTEKFQYKGTFCNGKIDGYGKIVFIEEKAPECEYEGSFKENKIEGNGIMIWKNGNMYQGEMKNGKMNGRGRFIPKDGVPIDGEFKDDVKINA